MKLYRREWIDEQGTKRTARFWSVEYSERVGRRSKRRRRSLGVTDRKVALMKAADLVRAGADPESATRARPPLELLEEYRAELVRKNREPVYIEHRLTRLRALLERVSSLEELTSQRIAELLADLSTTSAPSPHRPQGGFGPRTQNHYRAALRAFFRWLVKVGRWRTNPVEGVDEAKVRGPIEERRALTGEVLTALVEGSPIQRAAAYVLAATLGLRRKELKLLLETDLDLDAETLRLRWKTTKSGTDTALMPLSPWAVDVLRRYLAAVGPTTTGRGFTRPRGAWLLTGVPSNDTLGKDLEAAGGGKRRVDGTVVDLHALRVTFCTLLARADVPLQLAQRLMRHSTPVLTANVYTKLVLHDARAAVSRIKPVPRPAEDLGRDRAQA
jgi:integrase